MKFKNPINYFKLLKWSSRKLLLPIPRNSLVLEVGSGGNPHPYSSVLVERYLSNKHRLKPIEIDKRLILADACKLPFKDSAFDYSLSFHVLEHVDKPGAFLEEAQRTCNAGYIETPNFLYERLKPFDVHLLEIAIIEEKLVIKKKESAKPDSFIADLDITEKDNKWNKLFRNNPALFHVQLYWKKKINYTVLNDSTSTEWFDEPNTNSHIDLDELKQKPKNNIRSIVVKLLKKTRRNRTIEDSFFVCPDCKNDLNKDKTHFKCLSCGIKFKHSPIPDFTSSEPI